jgi:hypothetical protein
MAIVSTKSEGHFSRSAGGYFAGMVRKHERGEQHLEGSLWALREAKWGKAKRRSVAQIVCGSMTWRRMAGHSTTNGRRSCRRSRNYDFGYVLASPPALKPFKCLGQRVP